VCSDLSRSRAGRHNTISSRRVSSNTSARLSISIQKWHIQTPSSVDAPISDDDSTEFGEIVGDEDAQTPCELFRDKNMRFELGELLEMLDDRDIWRIPAGLTAKAESIQLTFLSLAVTI
jgi:DNA-directed RNA polymerase sigma subunit (sigma70/sigma32)